MNKSHKETISIRFISTAFIILAIAIFKPFGLDAERWQTFLHLLGLFVLGLFSCFITEVILQFIVRLPRSYERGINYIISRNLRFQLINTLLVALLICIYRHFVMSSLVESNRLSLSNYIEYASHHDETDGGNATGLSDDCSLPSRLPGQPWSGRANRLTFRLHPVAHQTMPRIPPCLA